MNNSLQVLRVCWQAAWKYPKYVIALLVLLPIAVVTLRSVPPLIAAKVLEKLSKGDFANSDVWSDFGSQIIIYGLISFGSGVIIWRIVILLIWKMESFIVRDLTRNMFNKYLSLGADFHANNFGGTLVSRTSKFVSSYIRIQDTFAFEVYTTISVYIFISIVIFPMSPLYVVALWVLTFLFVSLALYFSREVRVKSAREAASQNKVTGYLADAITNIMAIKNFASSKYEKKRFDKATEESRQTTIDLMWSTTKRDFVSSSMTSSLGILALVIAVISVVVYHANVALVFLIFAYTADVAERLWQLSSRALRTYNKAIGDSIEAVQTLALEPTVKDPEQPELLNVTSAEIEFQNMEFSHLESEDDVLFKDFSLKIEAGSKVGIVGHSGSGKTTLTRLLLRFMDTDSGQILIDDQDIAKTSQEDLRKHISYVPQEPILFHRSLKENISYGNPAASEAEIIHASKMAHAHSFIKDLPNGYDTLVGERGIKLSGGQRQRIAIARAMVKIAPILLLDEATSALDSESEKLIQDALWKLMEDKTAVVIAHRLSTIQKLDKIVVLDKGEIVESGSHVELLAKKGIYYSLWEHQSGGFLSDEV